MEKETAAVTEPIIKTEESQPVDFEALLKAKDDEIAQFARDNAQLTSDKENYRRGMLAAKGKSPEGDAGDVIESEEDRIRRILREEQASSKEAQLNRERDEILAQVLKENKELKVAIQNRTQVGSSAAGGSRGPETVDVKTEFFTADQIKDLERQHQSMVNSGAKISFEDFKKNAEANIVKQRNS